MPAIRLLAVALVTLTIAGCGGSGRKDRDRDRFECEGGRSFVARFESGEKTVWVGLPDHEFRLDRVETDAGTMYARGGTTLSVDGGVLALAPAAGPRYLGCTPVAAR